MSRMRVVAIETAAALLCLLSPAPTAAQIDYSESYLNEQHVGIWASYTRARVACYGPDASRACGGPAITAPGVAATWETGVGASVTLLVSLNNAHAWRNDVSYMLDDELCGVRWKNSLGLSVMAGADIMIASLRMHGHTGPDYPGAGFGWFAGTAFERPIRQVRFPVELRAVVRAVISRASTSDLSSLSSGNEPGSDFGRLSARSFVLSAGMTIGFIKR